MRIKRAAATLMALMIAGMPVASAQAEAASTVQSAYKNETVYAMLNDDGSVGEIYVVNQLMGEYTDYGNYSSIKNLSTTSEPIIDGDKITFPDENVEGGLYYQGTMQGELPLTFAVGYALDGQSLAAESLAGANGHMKIDLSCKVNEKCEERIRDGLMAQVTLTLNMDLANNFKAEGATTVITGNSMTVSFTALPGKNADFTLEADVRDFEMDGVSITLLNSNFAGISGSIDDYKEGFDDMLGGAQDMVDGTTELKDGMETLSDGMGDLSSGLNKLKTSGGDMLEGMNQYSDGLNEYVQGVSGVSAASSDVKAGLDTLWANGRVLADNLSSISASADSMASSAELRALAESLKSSADPSVQALANGTLKLLNGLSGLSGGLGGVSDGLNDYASGVQQAAEGYASFDAGLKQLAGNGNTLTNGYSQITGGVKSYVGGVGSSASGAKKIYSAIKGLPGNIQELIDGQIEFKDGIASAKDELLSQTEGLAGKGKAVSFASPDKNHPYSVQYILLTPAIKIKEETVKTETAETEETFFTRFMKLFS